MLAMKPYELDDHLLKQNTHCLFHVSASVTNEMHKRSMLGDKMTNSLAKAISCPARSKFFFFTRQSEMVQKVSSCEGEQSLESNRNLWLKSARARLSTVPCSSVWKTSGRDHVHQQVHNPVAVAPPVGHVSERPAIPARYPMMSSPVVIMGDPLTQLQTIYNLYQVDSWSKQTQ